MNTNIKDFRQLKVWNKAMELTDDIYIIVKKFPIMENHNLSSQILRSTCSIMANISEGNGVGNLYPKKEISFIGIAIGSATETRAWIALALRRNYISQEEHDKIDSKILEIIMMLSGFLKRIKANMSSLKGLDDI